MTNQLPSLSQVALCSSDLPRTINFYMRVFGFADARGETACGPVVAQIQGLGADTSFFLWWLTGRQKSVQLEIFQHNEPRQRPLPVDWRVSDIGWGRLGILVADFDACLSRLIEHGARPLTDPVSLGGHRRFSFRDPYAGIVVEVIEDEGRRSDEAQGALPAIANVAVCVSNLESARKFWLDDLGLPEDRDFKVDKGRERLWELEGADVSGFCVKLNDIRIEVMAYRDPIGRVFKDRLLSDQGLMNIGMGFRDHDSLQRVVQRLEGRGYASTMPLGPGPIAATYVWGPERVSVELFCVPEELEGRIGFVPRSDMRLF